MTEERQCQGRVIIPQSEEDTFDGPQTYKYVPFASPWYRDKTSISMVAFLVTLLLTGTIFLAGLIFAKNPWKICVITIGFLALAIGGTLLKAGLTKLRWFPEFLSC